MAAYASSMHLMLTLKSYLLIFIFFQQFPFFQLIIIYLTHNQTKKETLRKFRILFSPTNKDISKNLNRIQTAPN